MEYKIRKNKQFYPFKKGDKIDSVTVLHDELVKLDQKNCKRYGIEFQCDCGEVQKMRLNHFIRKHYKCCGKCSFKANYPSTRKSKGIQEFSDSWLTQIRLGLNRGKSKILKCEITNNDLINQLIKQNYKCIYSGIELNVLNYKKHDSNASIDRIDSTKNYTIDNIQWVYRPINRMKNETGHEEFIFLCNKIANFTRQS